jgi:DNA polymerase III subunit gamma/tau
MSYIALYRKWRPKTFDEVRGQDAIVTTLKNQVISGRIGHAYLFCGSRGTGKTSMAKILARAANCEHPLDGNPCNECASCRSILDESSINVMEIDAASNNGVDNIRDIREQVQYPPTQGRYKVFIIDEVHMLSTGAFNALLKTLEEPPEYVIFILATTEVHKIPATVLSRCQRYDFKRIPADVIADRLRELAKAEDIRIEDKAIGYIARTADGGMRDALSLLDECVAFRSEDELTYDRVLEILGAADLSMFGELFAAISSGRTAQALKVIAGITQQGRDLGWFASDFLWYIRNLLVIGSVDDASEMVDASRENLELMRNQAAGVSKETLMRYIGIFGELVNRMRYSSQKRVQLELAVMRAMTPQMQEDVSALLDRIGTLEKKIEKLESGGAWSAVYPAAMLQGMPSGAAGMMPGMPGMGGAAAGTEGVMPGMAQAPAGTAGKTSGPIELPKAVYDDLMMLRDDWSNLVRSLGGVGATLLKDAVPEPGEGDSMVLVFADEKMRDIAVNTGAVRNLEAKAQEKYGKHFAMRTRVREDNEETKTYVTRDELKSLINMPIEEETEE